MADDVLLNKAASIERCLKRIEEEYRGHEQVVRAGILPSDLGGLLEKMVGFRNLAVHNYAELDLKIVRSIIEERLGAFRDFARLLIRLA